MRCKLRSLRLEQFQNLFNILWIVSFYRYLIIESTFCNFQFCFSNIYFINVFLKVQFVHIFRRNLRRAVPEKLWSASSPQQKIVPENNWKTRTVPSNSSQKWASEKLPKILFKCELEYDSLQFPKRKHPLHLKRLK